MTTYLPNTKPDTLSASAFNRGEFKDFYTGRIRVNFDYDGDFDLKLKTFQDRDTIKNFYLIASKQRASFGDKKQIHNLNKNDRNYYKLDLTDDFYVVRAPLVQVTSKKYLLLDGTHRLSSIYYQNKPFVLIADIITPNKMPVEFHSLFVK